MSLRKTPKAAAWFLRQFSSQSDDESVIGDLTEQYQRDHGRIWYWRQVLSIVFGTLLRTARQNKWNFFTGLFSTCLVWIGLQVAAATLLLIAVFSQLKIPQDGFVAVSIIDVSLLYPLGTTSSFQGPVLIVLLAIALRVLTPLVVGRYCSRSAKVHPRSILLAFVVMYVIVNLGLLAIITLSISSYGSIAAAVFMIEALTSLLVTSALILLAGNWGMRGLSPLSPQIRR